MALHDLLQQGIKYYITNNNNHTNYTSPNNESSSFHVYNGDISSEIHLAVALRYFAGGSYLDISVSHGIGKTDLYRSVWAVVHAMNTCAPIQFHFPMTIEEWQMIFHSEAKQGLITVLDASMACYCGLNNLFLRNAKGLVLTVASSIVEGNVNLD